MCKTLTALSRGCFALVFLLVTADSQPGGSIEIFSSVSQKEKQLNLTCTVRQRKAAEGLVVFLCKDRISDCFPETSLEQLRIKPDPGTDDVSERTSELVFTIKQVTPLDNGTYQCCATSQKPNIRLQGHFFSILVTETGNYTVTGLKERSHLEFSHRKGVPSSGFLQNAWVMLVTSLLALQAL